MLAILFDENIDDRIVAGLLRRNPSYPLLRAQDVGLRSIPDPIVLTWAARERRIVVSHDFSTMIRYAYDRVKAAEGMPGLIVVPNTLPLRLAIDDLEFVINKYSDADCESQVIYLPLKRAVAWRRE